MMAADDENVRIETELDDRGRLVLRTVGAPADALIRYAYPWEGRRVLFLHGPYIAPVEPIPGMEVRFRAFQGKKSISEMQSFTFPGNPADVQCPTTMIPCTQNRDFMAYAWEDRHRAVVETVRSIRPGLLFLGDSVTHFFGGVPVDPHPLEYQSMTPDIWDEAFSRWNPVNLGFGNDRVENVLWRVRNGELDGAREDALFVILIGTNNMRVNSDDEIARGIASLCHEIRGRFPRGRVLLQGIYPRTDRVERVAPINAMLASLALPGVSYCSPGDAIAGEDGRPLEGTTRDGIHPTREGYRLVAGELVRAIGGIGGLSSPS